MNVVSRLPCVFGKTKRTNMNIRTRKINALRGQLDRISSNITGFRGKLEGKITQQLDSFTFMDERYLNSPKYRWQARTMITREPQ